MRKVPRILPMHMSMAANYWQKNFADGSNNAADVQEQFHAMVDGIQKYLSYDYERCADHLEAVYTDGAASLLRFKDISFDGEQPVMLFVPSLINKAHIFDVTEKRSMLRYFNSKGMAAYLLDWGDFLSDVDMQDMESVVMKKLVSVVEFLSEHCRTDIHVLGYCMGGTLLAGLASLNARNLKSLVFMAAPWDFHAGTQDMLNRVKFWSPSLMTSLQDSGEMKVDWLQILFSSLYPEQAIKKFSTFSKMEEGCERADLFVAVEDWLNDGVPLPSGVAREAIKNWFLDNATVNGKWCLGKQSVDVSQIALPSMIIASSEDNLVEYDVALALHHGIQGSELLDPQCGHIGMIASLHAIRDVWEPIVKWVRHNN